MYEFSSVRQVLLISIVPTAQSVELIINIFSSDGLLDTFHSENILQNALKCILALIESLEHPKNCNKFCFEFFFYLNILKCIHSLSIVLLGG